MLTFADVLLLECVPSALAAMITQRLQIPVIGIGAGADTDGQVLVLYDILGISTGRIPRFSRNFMGPDTGTVQAAIQAYVDAVRAGSFPADEHTFE